MMILANFGCEKNEKIRWKNITQIQKMAGIPVKIKEIKNNTIQKIFEICVIFTSI